MLNKKEEFQQFWDRFLAKLNEKEPIPDNLYALKEGVEALEAETWSNLHALGYQNPPMSYAEPVVKTFVDIIKTGLKHKNGFSFNFNDDYVDMTKDLVVNSIIKRLLAKITKKTDTILYVKEDLKHLNKLPILVDLVSLIDRPYILYMNYKYYDFMIVNPYKVNGVEDGVKKGIEIICHSKDIKKCPNSLQIIYDEIEELDMSNWADMLDPAVESAANLAINVIIAFKRHQDECITEELNPKRVKLQNYIDRGYKVKRHMELIKKETSLKFMDLSLFTDKEKMRYIYKEKRNGEPLWKMRPHIRREHSKHVWVKNQETGMKEKRLKFIQETAVNGYKKDVDFKIINMLGV